LPTGLHETIARMFAWNQQVSIGFLFGMGSSENLVKQY